MQVVSEQRGVKRGANEDEKNEENVKDENEDWMPRGEYYANTYGGSIVYDGVINFDDDDVGNSISIATHETISCESIQENFQLENQEEARAGCEGEEGVARRVMEEFSVTVLLDGKPGPMIALLEDMMWALHCEGALQTEDIVHIILPKKTFFHSWFKGMGFRKVATCINDHFDENIKEEITKGQIRMAAQAGGLLCIMKNRGVELPRSSKATGAAQRFRAGTPEFE